MTDTTDKSELLRQLLQITAQLESPESKGRKTTLKAIQRKLYSRYVRALKVSAAA